MSFNQNGNKNLEDLTGFRFGRWIVVKSGEPKVGKSGRIYFQHIALLSNILAKKNKRFNSC